MHIAQKEFFDPTLTPKIAQHSPKMLKKAPRNKNQKVREQKNLQNESE